MHIMCKSQSYPQTNVRDVLPRAWSSVTDIHKVNDTRYASVTQTSLASGLQSTFHRTGMLHYISRCQTNVRHETTPSQCQTRDYTKPMSDPRLHQANVRPETTPSQCQTRDYTKPMSDPILHQANVRPDTTPSRGYTKPRLHQANVRPDTTPSQCQTNVRPDTTPSRGYTKPTSDPRLHQANVRPKTTPSQCATA